MPTVKRLTLLSTTPSPQTSLPASAQAVSAAASAKTGPLARLPRSTLIPMHVRNRFGAAEEDDQAGEDDADHELAEHRWLAEPLGREPAEVGGEQEDAEREEDAADRPLALALAACSEGHSGPHGQDGGEQESDPGPHGGPSLRRLSGQDPMNVIDGRHGRLARQQREDHGQDDKRRQHVAAGAEGQQ